MEALIVVDVQNDFLPDGALPVPDGDKIIPVVNKLMERFKIVVATQDWHPFDHGSFAENHPGAEPGQLIQLKGLSQILWQRHCVQHTDGAYFAPGLHIEKIQKVFYKGVDPMIDSYSGFFDNGHLKSTGLEDFLKEKGVQKVVVVGLAADYCVKFTALDALQCGFETVVVEDATKAVNLHVDDFNKAMEELQQAGVKIMQSQNVFNRHL